MGKDIFIQNMIVENLFLKFVNFNLYLGMFTLPETDQEPVEEVVFSEPAPDRICDAVEMVRKFNDEGRPYLPVNNHNRRY